MASITLLAAIKNVVDNIPNLGTTYYYSEIPESLPYPYIDVEGHIEESDPETINPVDKQPTVWFGEFTLVVYSEASLQVGEALMARLHGAFTPSVFDGVVEMQNTCLIPGRYETMQLPQRSLNNQPIYKLARRYRLIFGGSFA